MKNLIRFTTKISLVAAFLLTFSCSSNDDSTPDDPVVLAARNDIIDSEKHLGVCYGPFHNSGQAPGTHIAKSQIQNDLALIAENFSFFRTYTVADGMEQVVEVATPLGLEVVFGVHIGSDAQTKADIDKAATEIRRFPQTVSALVIGNETDLAGISPDKVAGYMDYARSKLQDLPDVTITSCITGTGVSSSQPILNKCKELNTQENRVILLNIYPYYGEAQPGNIDGNMQWSYNNGMKQAEDFGLGVIIGEIGWPTATNDGAATPTSRENVANAKINYEVTLKWINGDNFLNQAYNTFWFSMFDEAWKVNEPKGVGPHWGLYDKNGNPKFEFTRP